MAGTPTVVRLDLISGSYGPIEMGMEKGEVEALLSEMGYDQPKQMAYGRGGSLITIGGINFRFTKEEILYQIYTLNSGVPMEGGLELGKSTFAEYEEHFGERLEIEQREDGKRSYRLPGSDLELLLLPMDEDPAKVFSIMLTRNDLR